MKTTFTYLIGLLSQPKDGLARRLASLSLTLVLSIIAVSVSAQCYSGDKEEPTVVCRELRTTFMPDTCMVEIWAKDMITSALDDKTPTDELIIAFDPEGKEMSKALFGEDGFEQEVLIWVIDKCGKKTACRTKVIINDNDGTCVPDKFDLALKKVVSESTPGPYIPGSEVTFDIEVINQGNVDAYRIEVTDYIPEGLILNDPNWVQNGDEAVWTNAIPFLAPEARDTISITFNIALDFSGDRIVNISEISDADDDEDPNNEDPVDEDSDPDKNDDNDGEPVDDATDDPADEDDHDPADIEVDRYDLAIRKTLIDADAVYRAGDDVRFLIEVINQGTIDATDVVVRDFVSANMTNNDPNWKDDLFTFASVPGGVTVSRQIVLTINADFQGDSIINGAEIISAENVGDFVDEDDQRPYDEIDCTADEIGDGEVDNDVEDDSTGGTDNPNDADECDYAVVPVDQDFDLSLRKILSEDNPQVFFAGDVVTFHIEVFNFGTLDASRVDIVDYIPEGLTLVQEGGWSAPNAQGITRYSNVQSLSGGTLEVGESVIVPIRFTIDEDVVGEIINAAEIVRGDNALDEPDCDSTPDSEGTNDNVLNDVIFDGCDVNDADEDDHDIEPITIDRYDLALMKMTDPDVVYSPGDEVIYTITVVNQGTVASGEVTIVDYIPADMSLSSSSINNDWTLDGEIASYTISGIAAAASVQIDIALTIDEDFQGTSIDNYAEISADSGDDQDSTPDSDDDNDGPVVDNDKNGTDGDEDDHDIETVPVEQIFDLALIKTLDTDETPPTIFAGDTVVFNITVRNQGTLDATRVDIVDYIPEGLSLIEENGWEQVGTIARNNQVDVLIGGILATNASLTIPVRFTVEDDFVGTAVNTAEIARADNALNEPDCDSTPDNVNDDEVINDNTFRNDCDEDPIDDEDDHDIEAVTIDRYDLALMKMHPVRAYSPGQDVTFTITVVNQGSISSGPVTIIDYIPSDMSLSAADDHGWTIAGANATNNTISNILPGQSVTLDIILTIDEDFQGTSIENFAEISADGGDDQDSTPDAENGNTLGEEPENIDDNEKGGNGENGDDEDDHDIEVVTVEQIFDLALVKTENIATPDILFAGDTVTFDITVVNQGTLDATRVDIVDYIPTGLTLIEENGWGAAVGNITGNDQINLLLDDNVLNSGESITVQIRFVIEDDFDGIVRNFAEISNATNDLGIDDCDSTPDNINDDQFIDNRLEEGCNPVVNDTDDEDDHDIEVLTVERYDLALMKMINGEGPFEPGGQVPFMISVINQGSVASGEVTVVDYLPTGTSLAVNGGWESAGTGIVSNTIQNIEAGDTAELSIILLLDDSFAGDSIINWAEISDDEGPDIDSEADSDNGLFDESPQDQDNEKENEGGDEDDHDFEIVPVDRYDLALMKMVNGNGPFEPGKDVTYTITVVNQGTITADTVEIFDYQPANMALAAGNTAWTGSGSGFVSQIFGLAPEESRDVEITFTIDEDFDGESIINWAEISNDDGIDIDSDPDYDNGLFDESPEDQDNEKNNAGGDEDDHDFEIIDIDRYDLALMKVVAEDGPFQPGDTVTYDIMVVNQGSLESGEVTVIDYIPSDLGFLPAINPLWTTLGSNATRVIDNILPEETATVSINLIVNEAITGSGTRIRNWAEIFDDSGDDIDSTPDGTNFNQDGETDDLADDNVKDQDGQDGRDEDDHDPAEIEIDIYDLALMKMTDQSATYTPGDDVTYMISVINQGSLPSGEIELIDYVPSGMSFSNNNGWTASGDNAVRTIANIEVGDTATVELILTIDASFRGDSITNHVEIAADSGDDIDSTPDNINGNGSGEANPVDNEKNNAGGDEDDHDPETIDVEIYDLALRKVITDDRFYEAGDTVTFDITVFNQGNVASGAVTIVDYGIDNLNFLNSNEPLWASSGNLFMTNLANIAAGDSVTVSISFQISPDFPGGSLVNWAEIAVDSGDDVDSEEDTTNDDTSDDDVIDEDGLNVPGDDEDDHDPAVVRVRGFDLALMKVVASEGPFERGDNVQFDIMVINQGDVASDSIAITDYIPDGLTFAAAQVTDGWVAIDDSTYVLGVSNVPVGDTQTYSIVLTIDSDFTGTTLTNEAEISYDEKLDVDSTPDADRDNDVVKDDVKDEDGLNVPGDDEDDHDPATITVDTYDLALTKVVVSEGPFAPGDVVTFRIYIHNQGTLDAAPNTVTITDYVPADMLNVDLDWVNDTYWFDNMIAAGTVDSVDIDLQIKDDFLGSTITNNAEITQDGGFDIDSTPADNDGDDPDPNDDSTVDGNNDPTVQDPSDDDYDPATISVERYDLALMKMLTNDTTYMPGDVVTFDIMVVNQGNVASGEIEIIDYIPAELALNPPNNGWDILNGNLVNSIDNISAGDTATIQLALTIDANIMEPISIKNWSEISSIPDGRVDIDSTPDDTNGEHSESPENKDNEKEESGKDGGDEDDHDFEVVIIDVDICVCPDEEYIGQAVVTCAGGAFSNEAVAAIIDLRETNTAPLGDDWAKPATAGATAVGISKPATWTVEEIGQVFGVSVGRTNGDIYMGATNVYAYDGDPFTPSGNGPGGEQGIYKANFNSPANINSIVTTDNSFIANPVGGTVVPGRFLDINGNNPLPTGWGNIAYDEMSDVIYGTNLSDGRIYAMNASTGVILQVFDPFGQATGFLSDPYPAGEVLWAIELNECTRELFVVRQTVAGGGDDLGDFGGTRNKEIYTIDINGAGMMDTSTWSLELTVGGTREKITDIDFNTDCDRMILAERGTVHNSLTLLYIMDGGSWILATDISVGNISGGQPWRQGLNSTGGVAFGADFVGEGAMCDTVIWTMGDCLDPSDVRGECNVYGPQGTYIPSDNLAALSGNLNSAGIFIDVTPEFTLDPRFSKFGLGDIEIFNCCCPDVSAGANAFTANVRGAVATPGNNEIPEVRVEIHSDEMNEYNMSNSYGDYAFSSLPMHKDYVIAPVKYDDLISGVTTLDLLLIQNHILGLKELESPYDIIAADIDYSNTINAIDIIRLRELLLGKVTQEKSTKAWEFIPMAYEFDDPKSPFPYENTLNYSDLDRDMIDSDFYGIKKGDVNGSYFRAGTRSADYQVYNLQATSAGFDLVATLDELTTGLQIELILPAGVAVTDVKSDLFDINTSNYHIDDNRVLLSIADVNGVGITAGESVLSISTSASIGHLESVRLGGALAPEQYDAELNTKQVVLGENVESGYSLGVNTPNPFSGSTEISFTIPKAQEVSIDFYQLDGKLIHRIVDNYNAGINTIMIDKSDLDDISGTVIYQLTTPEYTASRKMMIIK